MNQIIVQGVGYVALFFVFLSFQRNRRLQILFTMLIGIMLFVLHYCLLRAWTGAVMNLLEACVVYVAYKKENAKWAQQNFWLYVFLASFIVAGLITSRSLVSYLPMLAQIFGTIAVWQHNPRAIRFIMLIPRPLWFTYNLVVGSQAGVVAEIFIFLSVTTGIVRFDMLKRKIRTP